MRERPPRSRGWASGGPGYQRNMSRIYDETAIPAGSGYQFTIGPQILNVMRTPSGEWNFDAGGTDVVNVRAAEGGGFFVTAGAAPAYRSAFPAAAQLALRRLGLQ